MRVSDLWASVIVALVVGLAPCAMAHTRSQSASAWSIEGDTVRGRVEAETLDVTRLYAIADASLPMEEAFRRHVGESFALRTPAGACSQAQEPEPTPSPPGRIAVRMAFTCPPGSLASGKLDIEGTLFLSVAATHLHFLQASTQEGAEAEAVITDNRRRASLSLEKARAPEGAWSAFQRFVPIGMVHVWGGLDHIAFIIGLVLLARTPVAAAVAATGFTLGHTGTLGLSALGVLTPHTPTVESLIGFTVAYVALQSADSGADRVRTWAPWLAGLLVLFAVLAAATAAPVGALTHLGLALFVAGFGLANSRSGLGAPALAAVFGLIHGCGFAGALNELDLPRPRLLSALAGFNVGVEIAQIVVIVAALAVGAAFGRVSRFKGRFKEGRDWIAAALLALGVYWFVSRAFVGEVV